MKRLVLNTFFVMLVSVLMVACSKEEVAPFNPASPVSGDASLREGEVSTTSTGSSTTNGDGTAVTGTDDGNTEEGGDDTGGITDGGNSSDFDSKSKKKKN